ncbi:MAG: SMP-30/gluconolactonase/LRE family protein [Actinophytocola sp.]|uniref:SMP-30/gluconolactonase/LRE family protein n=1 Tax=Actinophytocola sp. TaxID=1872138 RepID=UPI001323920B|nr:SMP-30/gluconolactonase/LRE family protein [Actinophytocola sp.]MPZ80310.1 SMP-30/gluconolactonase/LRE family protein [Actinophytocola sp.]
MAHPKAHPNVLLSGLGIGESPRWHEGRLWFCNWGPDEVVAVDPDGKAEYFPEPVARPHSIEWLPDGRMLVVSKNPEYAGILLRREHDGGLRTHADLREIADDWNEIVVDGRGNIYVNNVGFPFLDFLQGNAEFDTGGITLVTPDGAVRQVAEGIEFANGMAVMPDNRTLVVAESFGRRLTAFDIAADGSLGNRRVWADGLGPDGICVDAEGAVWAQTGEQACVRVREGGEILDRVELDRMPFACMLGGETLFVMAAEWHPQDPFGGRTGQVLTVPAPAAGVGWP